MTDLRSQPSATRHGTLYIDDEGTKIFKVESTLFRVHTYFLAEHSALLRDMLNVGKADASEGSSDQRPIVLPNIRATEFELILEIFYTPAIGRQTSIFERESLELCQALLQVLEFLQMKDIREAAVQTLRNRELKPAEKLYLMRMSEADFDKPWASNAVLDLCLRMNGPDAGEGRMIGWDAFAMIWEVRESVVKSDEPSPRSNHAKRLTKALQKRDAGFKIVDPGSRAKCDYPS